MRFALILSALAAIALARPRNCRRNQQVIRDGGFESGRTPSASAANPWLVHNITGQFITYELTSPGGTYPGSPDDGGRYAFTVELYPSPFSMGQSGLELSQTLRTCPGQNYSISAVYRFESGADNNCAITIEYPYMDIRGSVTAPSAVGEPGLWHPTGSTFQAVTSVDVFDVVFRCSNGASNTISVDSVKIEPFEGNAF